MRLSSFSRRVIGPACAASICAFALPDSASAAIAVFGSSGTARLCYDGAEGRADPGAGAERRADPGAYVFYCDVALNAVLSPHDRAATLINRGVLRLELSEVDSAIEDFRAGLAIAPNVGEGYIDLGAAQIRKRQFVEAIRSIDRGLALGARRPGLAYYDRAIAHEALGDIQAAYRDYQQALLLQPDFSMASSELTRFRVVHRPDSN